MREEIPKIIPQPAYYTPPTEKKSVSSPCSVVLHLTDHHIGAIQKADEIEGFGEYSPGIAEKRLLKECIPTFIDWVELHRKIYLINEVVILMTGDISSVFQDGIKR